MKKELRRRDDWPFPLRTNEEEKVLAEAFPEIKYNPVGNTISGTSAFGPATSDFVTVGNYITKGPGAVPFEADPSGGSLNEPGKKADAGKVLPWLCLSGFANALEKVAEVTTLGAKKYTPGGWAEVPNGPERYMEAAVRHLIYLGQGEKFDDGPGGIGTLHKAQIAWNILASLELELREEKK